MIPDSSDENDDRRTADAEPEPAEPEPAEQQAAEPEKADLVEVEAAAPAEVEAAAPVEALQAAPEEEAAAPAAPDPLEEARAAVQRTREQLLRTAADFDNYRKRSRREIDDAHKRGREELLRELLPVFDDLERAAAHAGQATDAKAVVDGLNMVLRKFQDTLGKVGIRRISAVGQVFDPIQHEAIHQVETDDHPAGTVVEEVQSGYAMGDRLIRAAMVVVAKPRQAAAQEPPDQKSD
jgi:molecular chaperone GrpE